MPVRHYVLVGLTVKIFAIPTRWKVIVRGYLLGLLGHGLTWKMMYGHDASRTWLFGEVVRLATSRHDVLQTSIAETGILARGCSRATYGHTEALSC